MNELTFYYSQVASTFSVLLPVIVGLTQFRSLDQKIRLFIIFLVIGFAADLSGWYFYLTKNGAYNLIVRHAYDLFESVFLIWLITRISDNKFLRASFRWLLPLIVVGWLWRFYDLEAMSFFKTPVQVLTAFAASHCILSLIEKEANIRSLISFWILLGIFFYCFSTFFIMGLLSTRLSRAWAIHNFINIITNMIYFAGLLISAKTERTPGPADF